MKRLALVVLTLGLVSFSSFASEVELTGPEMNTLLTKISEHDSTPEDVVADVVHILNGGTEGQTISAQIISQKCRIVGRSALVFCQTNIGVESDTEDMETGFDSVYQLETVHLINSMSLLRVSFIPLAG